MTRTVLLLGVWFFLCTNAVGQSTVVSFSSYAYGVSETNDSLAITVLRGGDTNLDFTVDFATTNGTSAAGIDYMPRSGLLQFAAGVSSREIVIPILDDGLVEGDETFTVQLSNPSASVGLGWWPNAGVYILDNESPSAVDPTFNPGAGSRSDIHALALQPDGKVIIAGQFTAFNNTNRSRIARLNADGSLDLSFDPGSGANGDIDAVALQADGKVLVGGRFTTINGMTNRSIARLNADGSVDATFTVGLNIDGELRALALQPDGKVLIAGHFTSVAGQPCGRVARLNVDGTLDSSFNSVPGANDRVRSLALQSDGRILIGGQFTTYNGTDRPRLARLRVDGAIDDGFNPGTGADDLVRVITLQEDGKIYIGGDFEIYNGTNRSAVARLFADGSLDLSFDQGDPDNDVVRAIAVQPDGQVWIGGFFMTAGGAARQHLAVLEVSGQASGQSSGAWFVEDEVFAILLQADGRILIGGEFHSVNGVARSHIAQLWPDWSTNTIDFTSPEFIGYEVTGGATITVQRHGQSSNAVSVAYATGDGTAVAGVDYTATSGTLNFAPLETVKSFVVPLFNAGPGQPARTVKLHLGPTAVGALAGPLATAVLSITNSAGQIDFSVSSVTVGEEAGRVVLPLVRHGKFSQEVTVDYAVTDGTATGGMDYAAQAGTITFPAEDDLEECNNDDDDCFRPRWASYQYIVLPILNDGLQERLEDFTVTLSNPRGGAVLGDATISVVTILDNEFNIGFSTEYAEVSEGEAADCTVEKKWDATNIVTVQYFTRDGTAKEGVDYSATSGTLTFAPGEYSKSIHVPLINDGLVEDTKSFLLVLTNVQGGPSLGIDAINFYLHDNDRGVEVSPTLYAVAESAQTVTVYVKRNDDDASPMTVDFSTRDGSARAGLDYTAQTGTLTFALGQRSNVIVIPVSPNRESLISRTFFVDLTNVSINVNLGADISALVKILDDAQPGDADLSFNFPGIAGGASAIAVQRDGKVIVGYSVTCFWQPLPEGQPLLRLSQDGSIDASFHPDLGLECTLFRSRQTMSVLVQEDDRIICSGFDVPGPFGVFLFHPTFVSRLRPDGGLLSRTILGADYVSPGAFSLHVQPNGKILAAGSFSTTRGGANIIRLNEDGAVDTTFLPDTQANASVAAVTSQPDGKILLGGAFTGVNGAFRNHLARLNSDGSLDPTFYNPSGNNGCDSDVRRLAVLPNRQILVVGQFSTVHGAAKPFLARLNADGTVDTNFPAGSGPNGSIFALAVQADGSIVIGGDFTRVDRFSRPHIARLLANGAVDETFDPGLGPNGSVYDLAVLPDGDVIIFGGFDMVNGVPRIQLARLHGYQVRLEPPVRLSNGNVRIPVHGQPGTRFILQASDDLVNWLPLSTNVLPVTHADLFDSSAAEHSYRFYRALPRSD
jgi:uncharacterized delta-60 repeat protein